MKFTCKITGSKHNLYRKKTTCAHIQKKKKKKKGNITDITKITNYFLKISEEAVGMEKMCK